VYSNSIHSFVGPLVKNPVTDLDKAIIKLRLKYRSYIVEYKIDVVCVCSIFEYRSKHYSIFVFFLPLIYVRIKSCNKFVQVSHLLSNPFLYLTVHFDFVCYFFRVQCACQTCLAMISEIKLGTMQY